nr:MAG TPA: hypothetical protein [Caudoviricetes sp.]
MMYISRAFCGDLEICFSKPLQVVGCDEFNIYLADLTVTIDGLPYITTLSKDWRFVEASTGLGILFPSRIEEH